MKYLGNNWSEKNIQITENETLNTPNKGRLRVGDILFFNDYNLYGRFVSCMESNKFIWIKIQVFSVEKTTHKLLKVVNSEEIMLTFIPCLHNLQIDHMHLFTSNNETYHGFY